MTNNFYEIFTKSINTNKIRHFEANFIRRNFYKTGVMFYNKCMIVNDNDNGWQICFADLKMN